MFIMMLSEFFLNYIDYNFMKILFHDVLFAFQT